MEALLHVRNIHDRKNLWTGLWKVDALKKISYEQEFFIFRRIVSADTKTRRMIDIVLNSIDIPIDKSVPIRKHS